MISSTNDLWNDSELTRVSPQPVSLQVPTAVNTSSTTTNEEPELPINKGEKSVLYNTLTKLTPFLQTAQKYSSITFSVFATIHGIGVTVGPLISTSFTNELISLGREIYQSSSIEWWLVWGSLTVHVVSGVALRNIRQILRKWNYGDTQPRKKVVDLSSSKDSTKVPDENSGLIGGVQSYFGLGAKRSFSFKNLGMTPLQFSGYLLVPLVSYHSIQTRILPLFLEGDSSYITIEYITYLLNHSLLASVTNWILYPSLTILATYHTIFGLCRWLGVKDRSLRKIAAHSINLISLIGVLAVWNVSKRANLLGMPEFVLRKFEYYVVRLGLY
ncbi:hypothetical protein WICPIJ_000818 [Wickerhamomyces pijperi]|uniref:Mitochondrial adapter protein MCP1 transmembrane domain-containing protein n=1 Tax=Wickerhamomyces pijperi TaxID=599730 RepID=A0A9P8TS13_WICPI|nr:hypothetical protein WICPIJ_000818 [Wickerhamomyces pijperi]